MNLVILDTSYSRIKQYLSFSVWLISLTMSSEFMHVVIYCRVPSFYGSIPLYVYVYATCPTFMVCLHYFVCGYPVFPKTFVRENILSPLKSLGIWPIDHIYEGLFLTLYFITLIYLSVFMPRPHCFNYCNILVDFEIKKCGFSIFVHLFQDYFGYSGSLESPYEFKEGCFCIFKKNHCISIGITLNLQNTLGTIGILTLLSLPTHEYDMSFYLFMSF